MLVAYLLGSRVVLWRSTMVQATAAKTEITSHAPFQEGRASEPSPNMRRAVGQFVLGAVVVSVTAPLFAISAESAVEISGLSESFVGVLALGIATSLPEAVASFAALQIKAYDLAVANLFGSNAMNMVMFFPLDLLYRPSTPLSILGAVDHIHVFTGVASIVMMALALRAIVVRAKRTRGVTSGLIILTYALSVTAVMRWTM